jgi:hypothetical protein
VFAALAFIALAGCGPFGYLKKVSKDASRAVADAEAAGAEQYAPYEYWGAVAYLDQAKVLMAYSEYERSFDYGVRAKQLAEEAKRKADMRETGSTRQTLQDDPNPPADPNAPPAAPATDAAGSASGDADSGGASGSVNVGGSVGGGK